VNVLSPVVNVTEHAPDKDSSTVDSNMIIKEEGKDLHGSLELLLELQKKSDNPEKIEVEKDVTEFNLKTFFLFLHALIELKNNSFKLLIATPMLFFFFFFF